MMQNLYDETGSERRGVRLSLSHFPASPLRTRHALHLSEAFCWLLMLLGIINKETYIESVSLHW